MRQQQEEEQRKMETKHMVYAALAREDEASDAPVTAVAAEEQQQQQHPQGSEAVEEMPDDTDGLDPAQEVFVCASVSVSSFLAVTDGIRVELGEAGVQM